MDGSIGAMLGGLAGPMRSPSAAMAVPPGISRGAGESFGAQLEAGFRARAAQLGLELPATNATTATDAPTADAEGVDAIWQRAQVKALADGFGPGDAMMRELADAADARWQQRSHGANDYFS